MAHYLDKDGLLRFFQGLKNLFALKTHTHTTVNGHTVNADVPSGAKFTDTTYSSKSAVNGGTDVSLVTTGEKYTWNSKTSNTGTVTSVSTGTGLSGGTITGSGTIKAKLRSETALSRDSAAATETANRIYPIVPDKSGYLAVNVPWTDTNTQTLTGVKGNAESSYRTGNVNLTAANIGAAASSHTHAASGITSGTLSRDRLPGELWIDMGTLSSLPTTKTFSGIRTDMICARIELGTPSAQRSDWEINTDTADSVTISGTISGTTTCKLLLVQAESGTAS